MEVPEQISAVLRQGLGGAGYGKIFSQGLSGGKSEGADAKSDVSHSA